MLAALAIAALMIAGVTQLINTSLNDNRAQQAGLYQAQLATAASQLIKQNYATLQTQATAGTPVVVALNNTTYKLSTFLSSSVQNSNPYGQTPCLLIYLGSDGQTLQGRLVTEGGRSIPDNELGYVAANAGQGGGSIPSTNNPSGAAIGAYGTWTIAAPNPGSASCTGTETGTGHLVSDLAYNGQQSQNSDYLYRVAVPNDPAANAMQVPIALDATQIDFADCSTQAAGAIAADASGNVVNCEQSAQFGTMVWEPKASYHWRGSVADVASLSTLTTPHEGDVAMTMAAHRAYTYNGSEWRPSSIDSNGTVLMGSANSPVLGAACGPTAASDTSAVSDATVTEVNTDSSGRVLSCQNGTWQNQSQIVPGTTINGCTLILQSPGAADYPTCSTPSGGQYTTFPWSYNAANGTYSYTEDLTVTLTKPGIITASTWAHMNDGICGSKPGNQAQVSQSIDIYNTNAPTVSIAHTESQTPTLTDDSGGINNDLTQAGSAGTYTVQVSTNWATYVNIATPWTSSYCGTGGNADVIANTPVAAGWTVNAYY